MKFLIDENIEQSIVEFLKSKQYDILIVNKKYYGKKDEFLINKANEENRIIITNDNDFGFFVYRCNLSCCGIILFRYKKFEIYQKISALETILRFSSDKIYNHFIVASENKIRIKEIINNNL